MFLLQRLCSLLAVPGPLRSMHFPAISQSIRLTREFGCQEHPDCGNIVRFSSEDDIRAVLETGASKDGGITEEEVGGRAYWKLRLGCPVFYPPFHRLIRNVAIRFCLLYPYPQCNTREDQRFPWIIYCAGLSLFSALFANLILPVSPACTRDHTGAGLIELGALLCSYCSALRPLSPPNSPRDP